MGKHDQNEIATLRARVAELETEILRLQNLLAELTPAEPGVKKRRTGEVSERVPLRCSPAEKASWLRKADAAGLDLTAWARRAWDEAAAAASLDAWLRKQGPAAELPAGGSVVWSYRAAADELARWDHAAADARVSRADWQRTVLNAAR